MDTNTRDILDALDFIKERMVTKDGVRDIIKEEVPAIVRAMTRNVAAVSRMLGHTSLAHTLGYLGVREDEVFDLARKFDI
jgi:hypothetical protein